MYLQKVTSRKIVLKNLFNAGILKVNDENSRIRIHLSEAWIRGSGSGSGSTPKCHRSGTLVVNKLLTSNLQLSVADLPHVDADPDAAFHDDADPDPDSTLFYVDADPDPDSTLFYVDADPDPSSQNDADPLNPQHCCNTPSLKASQKILKSYNSRQILRFSRSSK
jgi:hypothetical protein